MGLPDGVMIGHRVKVTATFTVDEAKALRWFLEGATSLPIVAPVGWEERPEHRFAREVANRFMLALPDGEWETP